MGATFILKNGDLCDEETDAIVNPSNSYGLMGGGVAHTIKKKRRGGVCIEDDVRTAALIPVVSVVLTTAGSLKARYVIHSSTMKDPAERIGVENVRRTVMAALTLADSHSFKYISFHGVGGVDILWGVFRNGF